MEIKSAGHNFGKGEDEAPELLTDADLLISDGIRFVKRHSKNENISFSIIWFRIYLRKRS